MSSQDKLHQASTPTKSSPPIERLRCGRLRLVCKDGNASAGTPLVQAEVADGSVTTSKLDATILKYLKPEITSQPQASTIYAGGDGVVSFSAKENT